MTLWQCNRWIINIANESCQLILSLNITCGKITPMNNLLQIFFGNCSHFTYVMCMCVCMCAMGFRNGMKGLSKTDQTVCRLGTGLSYEHNSLTFYPLGSSEWRRHSGVHKYKGKIAKVICECVHVFGVFLSNDIIIEHSFESHRRTKHQK